MELCWHNYHPPSFSPEIERWRWITRGLLLGGGICHFSTKSLSTKANSPKCPSSPLRLKASGCTPQTLSTNQMFPGITVAFLMHKNALESRGESTCVPPLSRHLTSISPTLNFPREKQERTLFHDVRRIWKTFSAVQSFLVSFAGQFDQNMERKYLNYNLRKDLPEVAVKSQFYAIHPKLMGFQEHRLWKNAKRHRLDKGVKMCVMPSLYCRLHDPTPSHEAPPSSLPSSGGEYYMLQQPRTGVSQEPIKSSFLFAAHEGKSKNSDRPGKTTTNP